MSVVTMAPSSVLIVIFFAILTILTVVGCSQESNNETRLCKRLATDYHLQISCGDTGIIPEGCDTFEGLRILEIKHCTSASQTFLVKTEYQEHLGRVKRLNLSRNSLQELRVDTLGNLSQLRLIDLSHNELTTLDPRVFTGQAGLRYIDLSHNLLESLDLSDTRTHKLQVLDLSHNRLQFIDVGPAFFNKLRMLDLSHNNISSYNVGNTIRTQFPKLEMLDLSHNGISGTILRSAVDVFKRNVTIDLSYNDICRMDMRMTTMDVMIAKKAFSSRSYTTSYRLNDNPILCDCYAGILNSTFNASRSQGVIVEPFACEDGQVVDLESAETLKCPVPDYFGMESFQSCPDSCDCNYSILGNWVEINCSSRGLNKFPDVEQFPRIKNNDTEIDLILSNNQIDQLKVNLSHLNIVHLDLSHNKIANIDQEFLPDSLKSLMLHDNILDISVGFLHQFSSIRMNLSNTPLVCTCSGRNVLRNSLFRDHSHIHKCSYGAFSVLNSDLIIIVCHDKFQFYLGAIIVIIVLLIFLCLICKFGGPQAPKNTMFDVFISYSHKDAEFAEQVLYPGLEEAGLKVCIHTVHWQLGEAISDQIVGSVAKSKKTLIVLSNSYVNSEWTRMEFMAAESLTRKDNFQVKLDRGVIEI